MTITIFHDKDCTGASRNVTTDLRDLKGTPTDKPGSVRMTDGRDAVLMFKNDDWHGGALFIRGSQTVADLGSGKDGGRFGFGNSVRSIRVTPFTVDLNITVVTFSGDDFPGIWPNTAWAEGVIQDIITRANNYLTTQNALLQMNIARITFRNDPKLFDLDGVEGWHFPSDWKSAHEIDVIIVDRFDKEGAAGRAPHPCFGKTLVVAAKALISGADTVLTNDNMAVTLLHELGHYLGLGHGTADNDPNNIMFPDGNLSTPLPSMSLKDDQIREMQDRLANNISRRGDRNQ